MGLFGQEYNPEAYGSCCADLLIKDEPIENLIYGNTLGLKDTKPKGNNFLPHDGPSLAVVFNGLPLFTGDVGSGESNIRRWMMENDCL